MALSVQAFQPGVALRLKPTMSSRKLLALDFIKRYFLEWSQSPTLGEISAELGISNKRAHDLVRQLVAEKLIEQIPGKTRGIRLVDRDEEMSEIDVLVRLAAMGWSIGLGDKIMRPPGEGPSATILCGHQVGGPGPVRALSETLLRALTEKGLHTLPQLDHDPQDLDEAGTHGSEQGEK